MIRRSTMVLVVLTGAVSVALFTVKYRVQALEGELHGLNADIVRDREAIDVLRAEWAHLNDPARLRRLAERHLGMGPAETGHVGPVTAVEDWISLKRPPQTVAEREASLTEEMVQ